MQKNFAMNFGRLIRDESYLTLCQKQHHVRLTELLLSSPCDNPENTPEYHSCCSRLGQEQADTDNTSRLQSAFQATSTHLFYFYYLPVSVASPDLSWCQFYTLVAQYVGLNYHSVKTKEFASYFSCLESCPSQQTTPNHVKGHKNQVSKLRIKICHVLLRSATVLQPCKVRSVPVFQKGPQGFLESYRLKCCMLVNSFRC